MQYDGVNIWYFKYKDFLTRIHSQSSATLGRNETGIRNQSLWKRLNSFPNISVNFEVNKIVRFNKLNKFLINESKGRIKSIVLADRKNGKEWWKNKSITFNCENCWAGWNSRFICYRHSVVSCILHSNIMDSQDTDLDIVIIQT